MLLALDRYLGPAHELVLVGDFGRDDAKEALSAVHRRYLPRSIRAARDVRCTPRSGEKVTTEENGGQCPPYKSRQLDALFAGKSSPDGQPVLYVCQNFACQEPTVGLAAIETELDRL